MWVLALLLLAGGVAERATLSIGLPKTIVASQTPVLIGLRAERPLTFIQIVIQQIRP